ncbi:tripartite tricarboxylate transporter TctB family protein [Bosea psychrotolerans]|uniref:Putative tricarboxylic transport membrane protein n=1 Tax=Bosea psychrotolerans TaxID=1871628 RepID=A0A2S4MCC8_9HYPH|nr:tripartite tricarboxylate transporter TctB family protein [Bosea psychrotolerans]POR52364.1 putative tricarboxylic transport membrane protein [Bosea psychrotolerans]
MNQDVTRSRVDWPALVVAALLLIAAALVFYDARSQTIVSTYGLGPTAMPYLVSTVLAILGLSHVVVAFREGLPKPEAVDSNAILWLAGGLIGLIACIGLGGGFIIATAIVFSCTARSFGRQALAIDFGIGTVLGLSIFLLFSKLLQLTLPSGPLENLF